jgi:Tol biopolymer transport system component
MISPLARSAAATIQALRFVHSADLSPDGLSVAWSLRRIEGDAESIDLLLTTIGTAEPSPLVTSGRSSDPEFSPDGRQIAFLHHDGTSTQIAVLEVQSRARRTLTSLPQGVASRPRWSPDGSRIAFTAAPETVDRSLPYRVTRAIGWLDGVGLVDDAVNDIYVLDIASHELTRLTDEDCLLGSPEWHPSSDQLTYLASPAPADWRHHGRIRTIEVSGERPAHDVALLPDVFSIAVHAGGIVATSMGSSSKGDDTCGRLFTLANDGSRFVWSGDLDVNGDVIPDLPVPFTDPQPLLLVQGDDALVRVQPPWRSPPPAASIRWRSAAIACSTAVATG